MKRKQDLLFLVKFGGRYQVTGNLQFALSLPLAPKPLNRKSKRALTSAIRKL